VDLSARRQTLEGIGGALTESSAYVLAHLPKPARDGILDRFFGPSGARFTLARTPIGACDFCVAGRYTYADVPDDPALEHFTLAPDKRGFKEAQDPAYALLPLIKDALARNPGLKVVASPWTAPVWMKDNHDWYGQGRGGTLLPEHYDTFARYMVKYLQAYQAEGVRIWGVTPENEPLGNGGQWESMEFTAEGLRDYIKLHLGPQLATHGLSGVKIIQFDHNRDASALQFSRAVLDDPSAAAFVWGTGLHWYSATNSAQTGLLDQLRASYPTKALLHTEGCIDGIGSEDSSPGGAFLGWKHEAWWWRASATDWGFYWAPAEEKPAHPRYSPVHRYAVDLLEGLNHGFVAWIDWNIVLDRRGGPNHVNNFCAAPIMVDTRTGEAHVTPLYYVLAHFSRYLQPGDRMLEVSTAHQGPGPEGLRATAALRKDGRSLIVIAYNGAPRAVTYTLQVGGFCASVVIPGQALQSFCVPIARLR
jgi:glucosylceramidase